VGTSSVASTSTGARRLGRISTNITRMAPDPTDNDASTYSFSRIERVWPRTTRPMAAQEKKAITSIEIVRLDPNTDTRAIASSRYGNDSTMSMKRASDRSTRPPR
jgi:hypothetical protein